MSPGYSWLDFAGSIDMPQTLSPPAFRRVDDRGEFVEIIAEGQWESVIHGKMRAGAVLGRHYHKLTRIYFYLTVGEADVVLVDVATNRRSTFKISEGQGTYLEPGQAHAMKFKKPSEFVLTKSHRHDPENPDTFPFPIEFD